MYYLIGIFIFLAILCSLFGFFRVKAIRRRICALSCSQREEMLNQYLEPFGFSYSYCKNLFYSNMDAWQKEYGYCALYDQAAPYFQMVIDCEPIYFNAHGRTWLIEFWKGQYGINTGAEIGIYYADTIISPKDYDTTLFHAVNPEDMPELSMELWNREQLLFFRNACHWWLTGFCMGQFSCPADLTLKASITFQDFELQNAFLQALKDRGYPETAYSVRYLTVTLHFRHPLYKQPCQRLPFLCCFSQWKNRKFCKLFLWATRAYCSSGDRLLYLYYSMPFIFRKIVHICKPHRYKPHKRFSKRSFKQ